MSGNETIGITGGIGAGKSVVARVLRCNGFTVYDCDLKAKELMSNNAQIKQLLIETLGKDIYFDDGGLNRKKIASFIFQDKEKRVAVNKIVHKAVREDIISERSFNNGFFFIESAILATGGIDRMCDKIWLLEASKSDCLERVAKRDKASCEEIERRMETQKEEFNLLEPSKLIVMHNDDRHPLLSEILRNVNKFNITNRYTILC